MDHRPDDLDPTRATIADRELVPTASGYLTSDVAMALPYEALGPFKNLLKQFFSPMPWRNADADALSALVVPHIATGWWEHDLGGGITLAHGIRADRYELWVGGTSTASGSIFDRAFDGPVVPEATPHPRKVKFTIGGVPAPGVWYRRTDDGPVTDPRVKRLFAEPDVTDVMVAGDFVTVGIGATSSWEMRLEPLLALVTELYWDEGATTTAPERTREELLDEAGHLHLEARPEELHLLNPDDPADRRRLTAALGAADARVRRVAIAVLVESDDLVVRSEAITRGFRDESRLVRRTAVDAAADTEDPALRPLFEQAANVDDPWIRWKAVRALGDIGVGPSRALVASLAADPDFRVRFEVARVLREDPAH
jgi:hypothetical protein